MNLLIYCDIIKSIKKILEIKARSKILITEITSNGFIFFTLDYTLFLKIQRGPIFRMYVLNCYTLHTLISDIRSEIKRNTLLWHGRLRGNGSHSLVS